MNGFRKTYEADEDLIALYIQGVDSFGLGQADRYLDELEALFQRLADYPALSWLRTEYDPPIRALAHKAHIIVYEEDPGGVLILRVRHGHEDWKSDPRGSSDSRITPR